MVPYVAILVRSEDERWRAHLPDFASECLHFLEERTYRDAFAAAGFDPQRPFWR
jgi:hypothetical protein